MKESCPLKKDAIANGDSAAISSSPVGVVVGSRSLGSDDEDNDDGRKNGSYLVDPASSHMLVSKIKPCMCKHKP
jgi:hypothetical protein